VVAVAPQEALDGGVRAVRALGVGHGSFADDSWHPGKRSLPDTVKLTKQAPHESVVKTVQRGRAADEQGHVLEHVQKDFFDRVGSAHVGLLLLLFGPPASKIGPL
jgi:hypothetical protein